MSSHNSLHLDEKRVLVAAYRRLREDDSILAEARRNIASALDMLGLRGNARVSFQPLLSAAAGDGASVFASKPTAFWQ